MTDKNYTTDAINLRSYDLSDADKIIVMDNGKISGIGTHDELLKSNAIYQDVLVDFIKDNLNDITKNNYNLANL